MRFWAQIVFHILYLFVLFFVYIVSNVYGDEYLIWVIIKIKNNAQICSVVNEHVYFIISVAESDVKKKTLCGSSICNTTILSPIQRQKSKKTSIVLEVNDKSANFVQIRLSTLGCVKKVEVAECCSQNLQNCSICKYFFLKQNNFQRLESSTNKRSSLIIFLFTF